MSESRSVLFEFKEALSVKARANEQVGVNVVVEGFFTINPAKVNMAGGPLITICFHSYHPRGPTHSHTFFTS
ncbi:hypothetical protein BC938DRAFT_471597 [Jimgerdemannia flammicorona]|uniref:Uncharacterized protein n=1 Tax=Jimgerdemannia flammicorona TaxID=994334 RepID=A0A433Q7T3_9FUNG|nr:hypothetical protein BC938DRAFT_471597 [Jimgerdemannia flammicorona]